jgi:hypothetical protein
MGTREVRTSTTIGLFARRNLVCALAGHLVQRSQLGPAPKRVADCPDWVSGADERPAVAVIDAGRFDSEAD